VRRLAADVTDLHVRSSLFVVGCDGTHDIA
jgi:hypothetical protein